MNARDELATIREAHWVTDNMNLGQYRTNFKCVCGAEWVHDGHDPEQVPGPELFEQHVADAILDAGYRKPRTITTIKELDALPFESVIRDSGGCVLERWGSPKENIWASPAIAGYVPRTDVGLPATILWERSGE